VLQDEFATLANVNVKTAYIDGELCGVDDAGLPSFARTQAASDGERGVHLVYYAFDLLHIGGWDISGLSLIERKALLEPLVANKPGLQPPCDSRPALFHAPIVAPTEASRLAEKAGEGRTWEGERLGATDRTSGPGRPNA
jgi:ATP-dependent DNA ligase